MSKSKNTAKPVIDNERVPNPFAVDAIDDNLVVDGLDVILMRTFKCKLRYFNVNSVPNNSAYAKCAKRLALLKTVYKNLATTNDDHAIDQAQKRYDLVLASEYVIVEGSCSTLNLNTGEFEEGVYDHSTSKIVPETREALVKLLENSPTLLKSVFENSTQAPYYLQRHAVEDLKLLEKYCRLHSM